MAIKRRTQSREPWMTEKWVIGSFVAVILAAIAILSPVKSFIYTREEGIAVERRLSTMEGALKDISNDMKSTAQKQDEKIEKLRAEIKQEITTSQEIVLRRFSESTDRTLERMRINHEDVKERIREIKARK